MSDPADFETWLVSMHVDDSALMAARVSGRAGAEEVLAALASWWA